MYTYVIEELKALEEFRKDKTLPQIWYVKDYVWFWIKE